MPKERHSHESVQHNIAHTLSFSLFCAAVLAPLPCREYGACACWFAVGAAFETGRHPRSVGHWPKPCGANWAKARSLTPSRTTSGLDLSSNGVQLRFGFERTFGISTGLFGEVC